MEEKTVAHYLIMISFLLRYPYNEMLTNKDITKFALDTKIFYIVYICIQYMYTIYCIHMYIVYICILKKINFLSKNIHTNSSYFFILIYNILVYNIYSI